MAHAERNRGAGAFLCRPEDVLMCLTGRLLASLTSSPYTLPVGICITYPCSRQPCKEMTVSLVGHGRAAACRARASRMIDRQEPMWAGAWRAEAPGSFWWGWGGLQKAGAQDRK